MPKFWPRGHFGLEDLTSLVYSEETNKRKAVTAVFMKLDNIIFTLYF